jgi:enoyl-CoA hydratase/carnithine racemase
VPDGSHLSGAEELAAKITSLPPLAVRANVRLIRWYWSKLGQEGDFYTRGLQLQETQDFKESSRAFVEKRPPVFRGQ